MDIIAANFKHALVITVFVFMMMLFIDYLNVLTQGRMSSFIRGGRLRQYLAASFLGATPGCLGAFATVSFYIRGLISLGAVVGCMIATSGDEAFVMLAMFPKKALLIFGFLFVLGIIFSYVVDALLKVLKIKPHASCEEAVLHDKNICRCFGFRETLFNLRHLSFNRFLLLLLLAVFLYGFLRGIITVDESWVKVTFISLLSLAIFIVITVPQHYLQEHIWEHIAKKHLLRILLWSFGALLVVDIGLRFFNLETFIKTHMLWVFVLAALVGIIPESGPHLVFVMMFARGILPFSVLITSSIVQDGHGMLPLLSYSIKDSLVVKVFNLLIGIVVGGFLYWLELRGILF